MRHRKRISAGDKLEEEFVADKVFVFTHDEDGRRTGAGSLECVVDEVAYVRPGGTGFTKTLPLTQISPFPDHPGHYKDL